MRKWMKKRLAEVYDEEFVGLIEELIDHELVLKLDSCQHHIQTSRLQHCLGVAYRSYKVAKVMGWDHKAVARAGLLHDFYHYDKHSEQRMGGFKHLISHPRLAAETAQAHFELNSLERDIIIKHMWPMTLRLPRYKESWLIVGIDKYCAVLEFFKFDRKIISRKQLA